MTRDRRFKKRVRARISQTGESYSTACRRLRLLASEERTMQETSTQETLTTVSGHDFGFEIDIPENWRDMGPDRHNSPFEVARYQRNKDRLHDGIVNIFWHMDADSPRAMAEKVQAQMKEKGLKESTLSDVTLGDRPALLHEHAYPLLDMEHWASRTHYLDVGGHVVCVNLATDNIGRDADLFDRIAPTFRAEDDTVGIVFSYDEAVPEPFVTTVLQEVFNYAPAEAVQRFVRMRTQRECVVAMVARVSAGTVQADLTARAAAAGHPLPCRVLG